jgi:hypothetical protein
LQGGLTGILAKPFTSAPPHTGGITTPVNLLCVKGGLYALYTAVVCLFQCSEVGWLDYAKGLRLVATLIGLFTGSGFWDRNLSRNPESGYSL